MEINILFDINKSLEELEGDIWGDAEYDSSLVSKCHELRKKPVKDLKIEDLRLMIAQNIGLDYLIPLAIEEIEDNPLIECSMYPGDLLKSIVRVPKSFWKEKPIYYNMVQDILEYYIEELDKILKKFTEIGV